MQYKLLLVVALLSSMFAATAPAASRVYHYACHYVGRDGRGGEEFQLKISGARAQITRDGNKYEGKLDRDYNPRTNTNCYRYLGWDGLDTEWHAWLLIEKSLLKGGRELKNGAYGGLVKIQARGEAYEGQSYGCTNAEAN
ncbi:MAG: hypothetical protein HY074_02250 [Deltaproteobacteria bacterium]|nr:hypothetical protein [Deltaproteobacteria bacterium]